jgi:lysozyme family protein
LDPSDIAINVVLQHEGGFSNDPDDPGNWTSGECGKGKCEGTKYGISASQYPGLNIRNLTPDSAKDIYKRDYWDKYNFNLIKGISLPVKVFDMAVVMGPETAIKLLQRSLGVEDDGKIGPVTAAACKVNPSGVLLTFKKECAEHYKSLVDKDPKLGKYLKGWLNRARS